MLLAIWTDNLSILVHSSSMFMLFLLRPVKKHEHTNIALKNLMGVQTRNCQPLPLSTITVITKVAIITQNISCGNLETVLTCLVLSFFSFSLSFFLFSFFLFFFFFFSIFLIKLSSSHPKWATLKSKWPLNEALTLQYFWNISKTCFLNGITFLHQA